MKAPDGDPHGVPVPLTHVHVVRRQFSLTCRLHVRNARPVSPAHAAAISSAQTFPLHGLVAVATEASAPKPRMTTQNVPSAFLPIMSTSLDRFRTCGG